MMVAGARRSDPPACLQSTGVYLSSLMGSILSCRLATWAAAAASLGEHRTQPRAATHFGCVVAERSPPSPPRPLSLASHKAVAECCTARCLERQRGAVALTPSDALNLSLLSSSQRASGSLGAGPACEHTGESSARGKIVEAAVTWRAASRRARERPSPR